MKIKNGLIIAAAAGSIAGIANADDLQRTAKEISGYAAPHGYIYINQGTGERIVSYKASEATVVRGAAWSWDSSIIDPCNPSQEPGDQNVAIFTGVLDADAGDLGTADAVNYWSDWFEAPGDTIISGMTIGHFSQVLDPGEDGVDGQELLMTFTENDRASSQTTALAHSPILITGLAGAEDDGAGGAAVAGDGIIDFAEGNYWIYFLDFATFDTPTDIEVADTNGVSDGAFGVDSTFSGIMGVDNSPGTGNPALDGAFNCGFYLGLRQPGVAEGDGLIDRFPELAGLGLENPDGLDIPSLANIVGSGFPLMSPSTDLASYDPATAYWPQDAAYVPTAGEAIGSTDAFGYYNAIGVFVNTFFFGGFECDPAAVDAPFYLNPWSTPDIRFNVDGIGAPAGCNAADVAEPFNVLDLADINAFISAFLAQDALADIAPPAGVFDLADLNAFVTAFLAGCP